MKQRNTFLERQLLSMVKEILYQGLLIYILMLISFLLLLFSAFPLAFEKYLILLRCEFNYDYIKIKSI